jgi:DNA-binding transcriptional regulator YiaG
MTKVIYRNTTLKDIWENKEIRLFDSLYGNLPESTIGDRIYKIRKINNLSREDFANKVGVHCATIKNWEYGFKTPQKTKIKKLCSVFGVNISEIW